MRNASHIFVCKFRWWVDEVAVLMALQTTTVLDCTKWNLVEQNERQKKRVVIPLVVQLIVELVLSCRTKSIAGMNGCCPQYHRVDVFNAVHSADEDHEKTSPFHAVYQTKACGGNFDLYTPLIHKDRQSARESD